MDALTVLSAREMGAEDGDFEFGTWCYLRTTVAVLPEDPRFVVRMQLATQS